MSKTKTTRHSGKRKQEKDSAPNGDSQRAAGGELHQIAGGGHPALTTNQSLALSDNQNSLKANPRGPTSGEFHPPRKNYPFRSRADSRAYTHPMAIAVDQGCQALLKKANVGQDAGVWRPATRKLSLLRPRRQWDREKSVRTLA